MGIGAWWRGLWRPRAEPAASVGTAALARLVGLAEAAYDAMYDARRPKDAYEDACGHFHDAMAEAKRLGLTEEVARLSARRDHVQDVYNSQFRGS